RAVVSDREVGEARIGLRDRNIVVRIRISLGAVIRGSHWHADEAKADTAWAEQAVHRLREQGPWKLRVQEPRRGVGHRPPDADDALVARGVRDVDHLSSCRLLGPEPQLADGRQGL